MANLNLSLKRLNQDTDWLLNRVKRLWKVRNAGKAVELYEELQSEFFGLKSHWFKRLEALEERVKKLEDGS